MIQGTKKGAMVGAVTRLNNRNMMVENLGGVAAFLKNRLPSLAGAWDAICTQNPSAGFLWKKHGHGGWRRGRLHFSIFLSKPTLSRIASRVLEGLPERKDIYLFFFGDRCGFRFRFRISQNPNPNPPTKTPTPPQKSSSGAEKRSTRSKDGVGSGTEAELHAGS